MAEVLVWFGVHTLRPDQRMRLDTQLNAATWGMPKTH
jgi:hypothetical protein